MKVDQLTMDLRVRTVMDWILAGYVTKDIIAQCTAKWNIDERMGYKYLKSAKKEFAAARKGKIDERVDFYIAAKLKLYNEMQGKNTPKGAAVANDILDSMARLEGCVVDKMDLTSKGKRIDPGTTVKVYNANLTL